jgi:hypothetical protein
LRRRAWDGTLGNPRKCVYKAPSTTPSAAQVSTPSHSRTHQDIFPIDHSTLAVPKMKFPAGLLSTGLMFGAALANGNKKNGKKCRANSCCRPVVNQSTAYPWERLDKNNSVRLLSPSRPTPC